MASVDGLSLEFSDNRTVPAGLEAINDELQTIGAGVWPLDLRDGPADIRALLAKPVLDAAEAERVTTQFLLPRERLLQIVAQAGRMPAVADGEPSTRSSPIWDTTTRSCIRSKKVSITPGSTDST
jgi:hypothetical protein